MNPKNFFIVKKQEWKLFLKIIFLHYDNVQVCFSICHHRSCSDLQAGNHLLPRAQVSRIYQNYCQKIASFPILSNFVQIFILDNSEALYFQMNFFFLKFSQIWIQCLRCIDQFYIYTRSRICFLNIFVHYFKTFCFRNICFWNLRRVIPHGVKTLFINQESILPPNFL